MIEKWKEGLTDEYDGLRGKGVKLQLKELCNLGFGNLQRKEGRCSCSEEFEKRGPETVQANWRSE